MRSLVAVCCAASLALSGCASRAAPELTVVGLTTWDCAAPRPWVGFDARYMDDALIREHERVHVEQAQRFGCERWHTELSFPRLREALEREAWCLAYQRTRTPNPPTWCEER